MSAKLVTLYRLQEVDLEIAKSQKLYAALDDGTAKKKEIEAAVSVEKEAERLTTEAASELQDKELNLKSIEAKAKTFKDKMYAGSVTNPKELSSMEKEVEVLGRQRGKLEERILELYDIVEQRKADLAKVKAQKVKKEEELQVIVDKLKKDQTVLKDKLFEASSKKEAIILEVDPILLKRYESSRARFGGLALSKVVDGDCSACHTEITGFMIRELKADKDILTCENCGRILYLEK
jgi:uncharacterized protein